MFRLPCHGSGILVLVPGHKYPKMGGDHLYGRSDAHRCFVIYFFNPCFRVLMAWDKYHKIVAWFWERHGLSCAWAGAAPCLACTRVILAHGEQ